MFRHRLLPTPAQEAVLRDHCAHARYTWNLARLSRKTGEVWVPKAGWVRFRWSRAVPPGVRSYRVRMDRAGRWHIAFAASPDANSRESQARFACTSCGFAGHADVNAAINIAAGHAVTARGGDGAARPANREPHLLASLNRMPVAGIPT